MIYIRPGFPDLAPPQPPSSLPSVRKLDQRHSGRLRKRDNLLMGYGGGSEGGDKQYDGEIAWSSINHAILSADTAPTSSSVRKVRELFRGIYSIVQRKRFICSLLTEIQWKRETERRGEGRLI